VINNLSKNSKKPLKQNESTQHYTAQGKETACSSTTLQASWSLKEMKMLLHGCHSAGCRYVFYKYCKRKTSSNIEQAGEMYINHIHGHMYYCLKTNPLKD